MDLVNPYSPPSRTGPVSGGFNSAAVGLRWGLAFASPFLTVLILVVLRLLTRWEVEDLWVAFTFALPAALIAYSGLWWGWSAPELPRNSFWIAVLVQGTACYLSFLVPIYAGLSLVSASLLRTSAGDLPQLAMVLAAFSLWILLLAVTVRWRCRRLARRDARPRRPLP